MTPETVWKLVQTDPVPIGWVGFFVFPVCVSAYWLVRRFMTKNFWVCAGGLVLLSLGIAYQSDHGFLPAAVDREGKAVAFSDNGFRVSAGYLPWRLTTPVTYLNRLPLDPYSARKKGDRIPYRYATDGESRWIFASDGLDKDADIPLADYIDPKKGGRGWYNFQTRPAPGDAVSYDSSNGVFSSGDIVRTDSY
jgi:hypothetical protein